MPTDDNYRVVFMAATGRENDDYEVIHFYRYLFVVSYMKTNLVISTHLDCTIAFGCCRFKSQIGQHRV